MRRALACMFGIALFGGGCEDEQAKLETWLEPVAAPALTGLAVRQGQPYRLHEARGDLVLLAFGYTTCVDVCPLTLRTFGEVVQQLGVDGERLRPLYVSVDPARDTPARFRQHLAPFHPQIEGLFIAEDALPATLDRWGIVAEKTEAPVRGYVEQPIDPRDFYSMDHTASLFLVDGEGRLRARYAYGASASLIAQGARRLLSERELQK